MKYIRPQALSKGQLFWKEKLLQSAYVHNDNCKSAATHLDSKQINKILTISPQELWKRQKFKRVRLFLEETIPFQKPEKGPVTHEKSKELSSDR